MCRPKAAGQNREFTSLSRETDSPASAAAQNRAKEPANLSGGFQMLTNL